MQILARDLGDALPDPAVPRDVGVELVADERTFRAASLVAVRGWGRKEPTGAALALELTETVPDLAAWSSFRVLATIGGSPPRPAGARCAGRWPIYGGGTLREYRRRGAYRAVLAERLRLAREHGAALALVKGRVETSGPILLRAGFADYGEERCYWLSTRSAGCRVVARPRPCSHASMTELKQEAGSLDTLAEIERQVLWLSTAIIHHANRVRPNPGGLKVGGHQASSASMVSIMTSLWFRHLRAEDRVSVKPHASPVLHAINYLLGELDESYLPTLRAFGGLQSYPSRVKDPDPVDYSTGSVGIGATAPIWGAVARRYLSRYLGRERHRCPRPPVLAAR